MYDRANLQHVGPACESATTLMRGLVTAGPGMRRGASLIPKGFCDSLATVFNVTGNRHMSEVAVKKYIVRLSTEERETLEALISKGKRPAAQVLKARILLKADVSEAGEGWSDSRIVKALDTGEATVFRTRQRLVEEGFEGVLARKHSPNSARRRILTARPRPN
jgi:hypothetical protein